MDGDERAERVEARAEFFKRAVGFSPFLAVRTRGGTFLVRTHDGNVGMSLFTKEERGEQRVLARATKLLRELLGPESVDQRLMIDVGANIGTTCISALVEDGFAGAVAFEPEPENFRDLELNIRLNDLNDRIARFNVAISNHVGTCELIKPPNRSGKNFVVTEEFVQRSGGSGQVTPASGHEVISVQMTTLNTLVSSGAIAPELTGLLWMDAEGSEGHVLEGATSLTTRGVPIIMEWNPSSLESLGGLTKVKTVASECYTHFVDARRPKVSNLRTVNELDAFAQRFTEPGAPTRTDMLLLRLPATRSRAL